VKPVVALDIDGTLLDYHGHFEAFAAQYFGFDKSPKAVTGGYDARLPFHKYLGVSKIRYRQCKLAYRRGELKRSLPLLPPPFPQARELTLALKKMGMEVWLCTTRPYLSHDLVDEATRHNLRRNGVGYNGIVWGEHKYRELVRRVGLEWVVAAIDDLPEMCTQAASLGIPTAFAFRPHNKLQYAALPGRPWPAIETHEETLEWITDQFDKWKTQRPSR
jgi:hypothetical protein